MASTPVLLHAPSRPRPGRCGADTPLMPSLLGVGISAPLWTGQRQVRLGQSKKANRRTLMPRIVCEVHPDSRALEQLERLCKGGVQSIPFHEHRWEMPAELLPGPEVLLCKLPPRNL